MRQKSISAQEEYLSDFKREERPQKSLDLNAPTASPNVGAGLVPALFSAL
jgi:hypothetical protein